MTISIMNGPGMPFRFVHPDSLYSPHTYSHYVTHVCTQARTNFVVL